ncbi:MAG: glycosyltransferase family 2 protein [Burkholderiales bacterium]|nr:glycosyltransferase family 2 protein [Anaerolineae bacterium]
MASPDLAVVIVTWNVRALVLDALRSLYADLAANGPGHTIVYVVDNASTDGTPAAITAEFPQVKLIASRENLGFAGGNNVALKAMGFGTNPNDDDLPQAVFLLNPDTIIHAGAVLALYRQLNIEGVGLVGAQLSYGDGSFQHGAFHFPGLKQLWVEFFPTPGRLIEAEFNGRYPRRLYESGQPFEVDCVLGATMMLRCEVIQQTGMFDEQFFIYCEEIDWAWRIRKAGWRVMCVPAAHVVHLGGQSAVQVRAQSIINLWQSRLRLFRKHYPVWKLATARAMIAVGMRLKARQVRQQMPPSPERDAVIGAYRQVAKI